MIITQIRNLFIYLFIVGFFFFPNLQTACIILGLGLTFFVPKKEDYNYKKQLGYLGLPMILFYIMYVFGLLYSTDLDAGNRALQTKIPFLIFPFFLPIIFSSNKEKNFSYLKAFAFSGVLYVVLSFLRGGYIYLTQGNIQSFFSESFYFRISDSQIILHPTYGSVYFNFLFFISIVFLLKQTAIFKEKNNLKLLLIAFFSVLFIVFSLSKLGLLMFVINVTFLLAYYAKLKQKIIRSVLIFVSFLILGFGVIYVSPYKIRFEQAMLEIFHGNQNPDDYYMSTGTRIWTWKVTNEIISESGFWGVGTGDFKNAIENKFTEKNMESFHGYDSHQQYLQTTATVGYLGALFLILIFIIMLYRAVKTKNIFLFFLGLMYLLWGLTESMLERQAGVLFFVFFVFLIDNIYQNKTSVEE